MSQEAITFYDIASAQPRRTFAPNPWKTRYALNYKDIPYKTEWVEMPDITAVREKLGVPANRTLADGTPYHTLPVIQDPTANTLLGDSFEIALYLDKAYPDAPRLFRPLSVGLTAAWNAQIDTLFTKYVALASHMPFEPKILDKVMAIFAKRAGVESLEKSAMTPEQHEQLLVAFEAALGELAKAYRHTGGTTDHVWRPTGTDKAQQQRPGRETTGPFLDGDEPTYADFIIGAWLKMFEISANPEDWRRIRSWHDGLWARIVDSLDRWAKIK